MSVTFFEREAVPVLRLRADMQGGGPREAFSRLEAKLPTLKGRKFYATLRFPPEGMEYFACVAQVPTDDPQAMQLETDVIPGGLYAGQKLRDWSNKIPEFPKIGREIVQATEYDPSRPELEFYRSHDEVVLLVPVLSRNLKTKPP